MIIKRVVYVYLGCCKHARNILGGRVARVWESRRKYSGAKLEVKRSHKCDVGKSRGVTPVFRKALEFADKIAIRDSRGEYTYKSLLEASVKLAYIITDKLDGRVQERVTFICPSDVTYVVSQWACWLSGQIAIPLSWKQGNFMLEYCMKDCDSSLLITVPEFEEVGKRLAGKVGCKFHVISKRDRKIALKDRTYTGELNELKKVMDYVAKKDDFYNNSNAIIVYTSGVTGPPKGVVLTHSNLEAQVNTIVEAWEMRSKDIVLNVLPLHHINGIVNALLCPLSVGARCVLSDFKAVNVWGELIGMHCTALGRINVLMAVPVMYSKLLDLYDGSLRESERMIEHIRSTISQRMRLFVCGSAPVPKTVFKKWEKATGHQLLEYYGMTETGLVLANPLHGKKIQGSQGFPLSGVQVRLSSDYDGCIIAEGSHMGTKMMMSSPLIGMLQVKGESVFKEYWNKPNATIGKFTETGWFKTGDVIQYIEGEYSILGRLATNVIKTEGLTVSADHVEMTLLDCDVVKDVAIVGIDDKIAAVLSVKEGRTLDQVKLKSWACERLPPHAVPSVFLVVRNLPRDPTGRLEKTALVRTLFAQQKSD